jgi:sortase A
MRALAFIGKLLVSLGVGVLLFVAWTLWGTGIYTQREQVRLADTLDSLPRFSRAAERGERPHGPPEHFSPAPGDPVFRLEIPALDVNRIVVQGVGVEELKVGPGHYPSCRGGFSPPFCTELDEVWPGERGRVIVSGHRTTYDAPFWALNELREGDEIRTKTRWGDFSYVVSGTEIVSPNSRDIANPAASNGREIVLTTCNPRFSAAERLIVFAELEGVT